jgi:hypothetical protein
LTDTTRINIFSRKYLAPTERASVRGRAPDLLAPEVGDVTTLADSSVTDLISQGSEKGSCPED